MYFVVFLFWLALAGLVGYVAGERNRSAGAWALISLLFSPLIGLLALIAAGDTEAKGNKSKASGKSSFGSSGSRKSSESENTPAWKDGLDLGNSKEEKAGTTRANNRNTGKSKTDERKCLRKNKVHLSADYETCPLCRNPVDDGKHPFVRE